MPLQFSHDQSTARGQAGTQFEILRIARLAARLVENRAIVTRALPVALGTCCHRTPVERVTYPARTRQRRP